MFFCLFGAFFQFLFKGLSRFSRFTPKMFYNINYWDNLRSLFVGKCCNRKTLEGHFLLNVVPTNVHHPQSSLSPSPSLSLLHTHPCSLSDNPPPLTPFKHTHKLNVEFFYLKRITLIILSRSHILLNPFLAIHRGMIRDYLSANILQPLHQSPSFQPFHCNFSRFSNSYLRNFDNKSSC